MLLDTMYEVVKPDRGAQFVLYLISHADPKTKIFSRNYRQIKNDLDISEPTIAHYFKILEDNGTIVRNGLGGWFIKAVVGESSTCDGPEPYVTKGYIPHRG